MCTNGNVFRTLSNRLRAAGGHNVDIQNGDILLLRTHMKVIYFQSKLSDSDFKVMYFHP